MRFEVKAGGIAAIVVAMTLLSGAVFVLGLLAGYDVGRQAQIDTAQLATSYPLPPAATSSQASNQSLEGGASSMPQPSSVANSSGAGTTSVTALADDNSVAKRPNPAPISNSSSVSGPNRLVTASTSGRSTTSRSSATDAGSTSGPNSEAGDESGDSSEAAGASGRKVAATESHRRKPYNIEIEAAMDIAGADQMMERLQKLGYSSHLVPTEIDGQRWYKVEVGPYATAEEASAAEAELRQRYDATYGGVGRRSVAGSQNSASEDSEE